MSAPISFFDPVLLSLMTQDWRNMARIVGEALVVQMDERVHQSGDLLLAARIRSMVDSGLAEAQGDYFGIQKCKDPPGARPPAGPDLADGPPGTNVARNSMVNRVLTSSYLW